MNMAPNRHIPIPTTISSKPRIRDACEVGGSTVNLWVAIFIRPFTAPNQLLATLPQQWLCHNALYCPIFTAYLRDVGRVERVADVGRVRPDSRLLLPSLRSLPPPLSPLVPLLTA